MDFLVGEFDEYFYCFYVIFEIENESDVIVGFWVLIVGDGFCKLGNSIVNDYVLVMIVCELKYY